MVEVTQYFVQNIAGKVDVATSFPLSKFFGGAENAEVSFAVGGADADSTVLTLPYFSS